MNYNELEKKEFNSLISELYKATNSSSPFNLFGGSDKEIKMIISYLNDGEVISGLSTIWHEKKQYTIAITSDRLILVSNGVFSDKRITIDYDSINSIDYSTGITNGKIKINSSGVNYAFRDIPNKCVEPTVNLIKKLKTPKNDARTSASSSDDVVSAIERLHALLVAGAITNEEYELQKKKILG